MKWNEKKCAVIHVNRGQVEQGSGAWTNITPIKFLGVFENTKQEDKQVLEAAAKT